ncbi:resistin-like [Glandiceps talaboti]
MKTNLILLTLIGAVFLSLTPSIHGASLQCINKGIDGQLARNYATCPVGYIVTGCSCGMACGSYTIQTHHGRSRCYCHAGCNGGKMIDWTSARCCKVY